MLVKQPSLPRLLNYMSKNAVKLWKYHDVFGQFMFTLIRTKNEAKPPTIPRFPHD